MSITREHFAKTVVASGLLTGDELQEFWKRLPADARPLDGDGFARRLVAAGKLTPFQATEILAGRGQRLVLEPYILLEKLGSGGMGQVFKARHRTMKRLVAVKVLPPEMVQNEHAVKRFQREAEVAARLSHANIVQAHDAGQQHGLHYLVMEFVEGIDLVALVRERGPLPVDEAVDYVLQAARGLAYAHGEGIVHRDIKPGNLLLDKRGKVKILDMGLARLEAPGDEANLTRTGEMMGTPDYMAPEQALDTKSADARADVYSLGCTLFRLLTGELPYAGETFVQMLMAHCESPIPDLRARRPDTPEGLKAIFDRMVAKQPEARYQLMTEVIADLEAFQRGETPALGAGSRESGVRSQGTGARGQATGGPDVPILMGPAVSTAVQIARPQTVGLEETVGYTRAKEETGKPDAGGSPPDQAAATVPGQVAAKGPKVLVYVLAVAGVLIVAGIGAVLVFVFGG